MSRRRAIPFVKVVQHAATVVGFVACTSDTKRDESTISRDTQTSDTTENTADTTEDTSDTGAER